MCKTHAGRAVLETEMQALTLKHPWGFCVCRLGKRIENRTWLPPRSLIGQRFAIHGGKVPTSKAELKWIRDVYRGLVRQHGEPTYRVDGDLTLRDVLSFTGIVATAVLSHTVTSSSDPWFDGTGYGWVLTDLIVLPEPIPISGKQGLWTVPRDVEERIEESCRSL
jgi:hypothetical protein